MSLQILTPLAVLLLLGIISAIISKKLKMPSVLLLLLIGIFIGNLPPYKGRPLVEFGPDFLTSIGLLALVMIVFDSASRFKIREFDKLSIKSLELTAFFLLFNIIFLTMATIVIFKIHSILIALLFATLMSGTDPAAVLTMFSTSKNKLFKFLEIESLINTPIVVLIPFIILDFMRSVTGTISLVEIIDQIVPFLRQFVAGIGAGILIGAIFFRVMKKFYSEKLSPLALITAALLTFILAENLGGNGVLAVTVMGLFFGNVYVKEKMQLKEFSAIFANALDILVFILIGLIIKIPLTVDYFLRTFGLYLIYILIRYFAVSATFKRGQYNVKEMIFMSLNIQKGIAVAVVAFTLTTITDIPGIGNILNLILTFMLYSINISTIAIRFSKFFVQAEVEPEK